MAKAQGMYVLRNVSLRIFKQLTFVSDAFALNYGSNSWQPARIHDAYNAASSHGFKMFISLDMTALNCGDNSIVSSVISKYKSHPAQLKDSSNAVIVSTFDGGSCKSNGQWQAALSASGAKYRFVPAFFSDLTSQTLKSEFPVIGGDLLVSFSSARNLL